MDEPDRTEGPHREDQSLDDSLADFADHLRQKYKVEFDEPVPPRIEELIFRLRALRRN